MSATIMDGKALATTIKATLRNLIPASGIKPPTLSVIRVGSDPASAIYVRNKMKDCAECGIVCHDVHLPATISELELMGQISQASFASDGVIIQLPLPGHLNERRILNCLDPHQDVDGFTKMNIGKLWSDDMDFDTAPCTPYGIIRLLQEYNIDISGKYAVIIGRSDIVGKPMAALLLQRNATVTICHSKTQNLADICRQADILVSAAGKQNLVTADMVKDGAVVIDVGMNRDENGKLCGDVDFDAVVEKASFITPVPGGVGPMTRAMLLQNVYMAWERNQWSRRNLA